MRRVLAPLFFVASILCASSARADSGPNPEALKHFLEGRRLRDEDRCAEAIGELEASLQIEKSIGAYYNLGVCSEKTGDKRAALLHYSHALDLAKKRGDDREREIRAQLSEFLEKTPHIRLALPKPLPDGLEITVDGDAVPRADFQTETKYFVRGDKLTYEVVATAPGYQPTRVSVDRAALKRRDIVQVVLRREGVAAPDAPSPGEATDAGFGWQRWAGIGVAGTGVVVLGVSAILFIDYLGDRSDLDRQLTEHPCHRGQDPNSCEPSDYRAGEDPQAAQASFQRLVRENNDLESDIKVKGLGTVIASGVLIVGGLVLFLTAPSGARADGATASAGPTWQLVPRIGVAQQGVSLVGTF